MSFWIWARSGQPAVVRAIVTVTAPSASMSTALTMPRSTMSLPSSGSMTPRRSPVTVVLVGRRWRGGGGHGRILPVPPRVILSAWRTSPRRGTPRLRGPGRPGSRCSRRSVTTPGTPSTSSWPARPARSAPPTSRPPSTCTPTPCGPTSNVCETSVCSSSRSIPRGAVGRPQHLYSVAADAPGARARATVHAAAGPDAPAGSAESARLSGDDAVEAGRAQGADDADRFAADTPCTEALLAQSDVLGFDPEIVGERRRGDRGLHPLPLP